MPGPNEIRAALCKTLSRDEVARSIGSAGLHHLQAVFEEEFGTLEASRSFWRSVDKAAQNSPSITWDISIHALAEQRS
jgi:hypothetical protein